MNAAGDDLEAVRKVVEALQPFDADTQKRIVRWSLEKLNLEPFVTMVAQQKPHSERPATLPPTGTSQLPTDVRSFIGSKQPKSDTQMAATVAYYYRFVAPESARKEEITADDLQDACRKAGANRMKNPGQALRNAIHVAGTMDNGSQRGTYRINAVGENLVAMTLPAGASAKSTRHPSRRPGKARPTAGRRHKSR